MATTTERLQIIIEALNMSKDEMKQLQNDLEGTDTKARQSKKGIGGMRVSLSTLTAVAGSATAAFYTLKKAFDMAEQGAQLELTQHRFERLAESIGTTASVLEDDLDEATRGMMSRFEAMDLATQLMALGLAKNHKEAVRLTSIASQLNMNMNQLVLTLTNRTTMRFDALGVSVDGFKGKVKELEDAGHSANEAFKLAFMEQSEEQIERVGSAADTAAGEFKIFRARIKDLRDEAKLWMMEALEPAIEKSNEHADVRERLKEAVDAGAISEEQYQDQLRQIGYSFWEASDAIEWINRNMEEHNQALLRANPNMRAFNSEMQAMAESGERLGESIKEGTELGLSALKNFTQEAIAGTRIDIEFKKAMEDQFISEAEFSKIEYLADVMGYTLPDGIDKTVENFNKLGGELDSIEGSVNRIFDRDYTIRGAVRMRGGGGLEGEIGQAVMEELANRMR